MMYLLVFSMTLWLLSDLLGITWLFIASLILFMGIVGFILVYVNTKDQFKKEDG